MYISGAQRVFPFHYFRFQSRNITTRSASVGTIAGDGFPNVHENQLLPNFDQGFSTLLEDLHQRGLDSETLVVCLGEFGRTPTINANAGRDHWAACNSIVLAGAGIDHGKVYGRSDRNAAYPVRNLVAPSDLSATIYHLLGIDPHSTFVDRTGQHVPLVPRSAEVVPEMLA